MITTRSLATKDGSTEAVTGSKKAMEYLARQWSEEHKVNSPTLDATFQVFRLNDQGLVMNTNDPQGHNWRVSESGHPFMTGWTCRNCKKGTTTYDESGDDPRLNEPCI